MAAVVGIRWGDFAIGGSDYHCCAGQARMFVQGRVSLASRSRSPCRGPMPRPVCRKCRSPIGGTPLHASGDSGLFILMMTLLEQAARRLPARAGFAAMVVVTVVLGLYWLRRADDVAVFRLKALEQK